MNLFLRRINGLYINARAYVDYCNEITKDKKVFQSGRTKINGISLGGVDTIFCDDKCYFFVSSLQQYITKLKNCHKSSNSARQRRRGQYLEMALNHFLNSKKQSRIEEISKEMKAAVQHYEEQMLIGTDNVIQFDYAA